MEWFPIFFSRTRQWRDSENRQFAFRPRERRDLLERGTGKRERKMGEGGWASWKVTLQLIKDGAY